MSFETTIISIPNKKTVLIKGGVDQGINVGDEFRIISKGKEVIDPNSHESLGTYDLVKAKLEVTQVYELFSELKKVERISSPLFQATLSMTQTKVITKNIPVSESEIDNDDNDSENSNSTIQIGDTAQKL